MAIVKVVEVMLIVELMADSDDGSSNSSGVGDHDDGDEGSSGVASGDGGDSDGGNPWG